MANKTIQAGEQRRYKTLRGRVVNVPLRTLLTADQEITHVRVRENFPEAGLTTVSLADDQGNEVRAMRNATGGRFCLARLPLKAPAAEATFGDREIVLRPLGAEAEAEVAE